MKELILKLEYDKLYFDDLMYFLKSLSSTTRNFYNNNEFWFNDKIFDYLNKEKLFSVKNDEYYKLLVNLKDCVIKNITYEIIDFSKGSLKIKCWIAIHGGVVAGLNSLENLPVGITIGIITQLLEIIYSHNEKEYDHLIGKLKEKLFKKSKKISQDGRKVGFSVEKL